MVNNTCIYKLGGNKIGASNPQHMGIIRRQPLLRKHNYEVLQHKRSCTTML
jgi:hypothetical protein